MDGRGFCAQINIIGMKNKPARTEEHTVTAQQRKTGIAMAIREFGLATIRFKITLMIKEIRHRRLPYAQFEYRG